MIYEESGIAGAFIVKPERRTDERGFFARMYCQDEFSRLGSGAVARQINTGFSPRAGTLRGIHYQMEPHAEVKIMRCIRGAAFDVIVDLRPDSPTYRRWFGQELSADNGWMIYAPEGTAHGYLTLSDDTEMLYITSKPYAPAAARGVRFDDRAFAVEWPAPVILISQSDLAWPEFRP